MANLKDTIVLGNLTVTGTINGNIQSSGGTSGVFGSGTSGYLTKWIGSDTIANGPQIGTDTTKFLNNKGEWAVPPNTTYSAGTGLSLSGTTFSLNASTSNLSGYGNYLVKCSNSMSGWSDGPANLSETWYKENSFMGSASTTDFSWQNIINIRHRGGGGEGDNSSYGMQIRSSLTSSNDRLYYRHQVNDTWYDWISVANLSDIPTKTSQLTNDSKFAVQYSCTNNWIPKVTSSGLQNSPLSVNTDCVYCNIRLRGEKFFTKNTKFDAGGCSYVTTLGYAQTLGYSATPVDGQTYLHSIGLDGDGDGLGTSSIFVRVLKVPANTWTTVYNIGNAGVFFAMGCSYQGNRVYFLAHGYALNENAYNATKLSGSGQIAVQMTAGGYFQIKSTVDLNNIAVTIFRTYR